jgi:hypothetical protein
VTAGRPAPALELTREAILGHRRRAGALDERLPAGGDSLRHAAWAGLTDSMPRAALLSIHARVRDTPPDAWEDPSLVQVWGPRFSAYVVPSDDWAPFTLGRMPEDAAGRRRAIETADRLEAFLAGRTMTYSEAGHGMGHNPNALRYATTTGRVLIRWDGARRPTVRMVPAPDVDPPDARLELARRYLHALGPGTAAGFSNWAGIRPPRARSTIEALAAEGELESVRTPIGDGWILASDEASFRARPDAPAAARLLPSGDVFYLLHGADRELLVPDARQRGELWTSRVWPGAVLVGGDVVGTWRRGGGDVVVATWRALTADERAAVEAEAASLPLPDLKGAIRVGWAT